MGDVFACHIVNNPPKESEIELLRSYAPNVSMGIITRLTDAFSELRSLSDEGTLSYPYSTRECVAIVKHLEKYPKDSLSDGWFFSILIF